MRYLITDLIADTAPPAPACFSSEAAWRDWLAAAHCSGERVVRRVDIGKTRGARETYFEVLPVGRVDYCADCLPARRQCMMSAGRCKPSAAAIEAGTVPAVSPEPLREAA
ncbi:hypothetical protein [Aquabacterium sp.]|uniref:hypothetical protein n=1 Tax=Aquabacterium sp. TaxID=1872578 RepID=UPI003783AFA1